MDEDLLKQLTVHSESIAGLVLVAQQLAKHNAMLALKCAELTTRLEMVEKFQKLETTLH